MRLQRTFILLFFFLSSNSFALINLDVVLIHKKGIDKDLILVSEIQSTERIFGTEFIRLNLKNEIRLSFQAEFVDDSTYGPSSHISLTGDVVNAQKETLIELNPQNARLPLSQEKTFTYQSENADQLVEVRIRPYLE